LYSPKGNSPTAER